MSKYQFGFLGCGNMGGALARAAAQSISCDKLAVSDLDAAKTAPFEREHLACAVSPEEVVKESLYLFIAVKPQVLESVFQWVAPLLAARQDAFCLVSMVVGASLDRLEKLAGVNCPVIRMMPNTPVGVGTGMIVYAPNEQAGKWTDGFTDGLKHAGIVEALPEKLINAAGALSGCGPAFVYLFAEALADGGVECGLPRDKANVLAAQTLKGAAEMLLQSDKGPGELKDAVCSPGGTTIAGVHALERGSFRGTVMDAVEAAYRKTAQFE